MTGCGGAMHLAMYIVYRAFLELFMSGPLFLPSYSDEVMMTHDGICDVIMQPSFLLFNV